ncbi:MAG TPA: GntR family transcriptional regulator [Clostridiaceae bacterium]
MIDLNSIKLNRTTPIPLYYQLKLQLKDIILENVLESGEQIPNEVDMVESLSISRSTVRQAINELVFEGYLLRVKAKGTFISRPKVNEGFFQILESFNQEMLLKGLKPSTRVIALKTIKGIETINSKLGLSLEAKLIYLARVRYSQEAPLVYLETYLSYDKYQNLLFEDFTLGSLYSILEVKYNTRIVRAEREIEAVLTKGVEARLLDMKKNSAICLVKTLAYSNGGAPVEYSVARYRGDRNKFTLEIIRK